jgi:hypothetical protein
VTEAEKAMAVLQAVRADARAEGIREAICVLEVKIRERDEWFERNAGTASGHSISAVQSAKNGVEQARLLLLALLEPRKEGP